MDSLQSARRQLEELAAVERRRPEPTQFSTEVMPDLGAMFDELRANEDRRIADERMGLPTKPFAEMNGFEVIQAMSSYDEPSDYPEELELKIQAICAIRALPPPALTAQEESELLELNHLRQQATSGMKPWMFERLKVLRASTSDLVAMEAIKMATEAMHPYEDVKPTRGLKPKKNPTRN